MAAELTLLLERRATTTSYRQQCEERRKKKEERRKKNDKLQQSSTHNTTQNNIGDMQQQLRSELSDRSVRLFPSRRAGRVVIEVQEDKLSVFLDNLSKAKKDRYPWSQGKEETQTEICEEVECQHTQAEHREMVRTLQQNLEQQRKECADYKWDLEWYKNNLERLENDLEQARVKANQCSEHELALERKDDELDQAVADNKRLNGTLIKVFKDNLKHKLDVMKAERQKDVSLKATLDASINEIQLRLQTALSRSNNQEENRSTVGESELQIKNLKTALTKSQKTLESYHVHWKYENASLLRDTKALKETLKAKTCKLDATITDIGRLQTAVSKAEDQKRKYSTFVEAELEAKNQQINSLKDERSSLFQETLGLRESLKARTSQLDDNQRAIASNKAQLEQQISECITNMAALKEAESRFDCSQNQWEEEKTSLLQETEVLNKTLQQNQQESEEKERAMTSELEDLNSQLQKKKKKKKWFRRLICC